MKTKSAGSVETRAARESALCVFGTSKNRCFKPATLEIRVLGGAWLPCCATCLNRVDRGENS